MPNEPSYVIKMKHFTFYMKSGNKIEIDLKNIDLKFINHKIVNMKWFYGDKQQKQILDIDVDQIEAIICEEI